jgi:FtsH-binding integral membrane protein
MNYAVAVILYVVFAILVGLCGSQRRMGFIGTFIVSLLFTPVIVLIVLLLTGPSQRVIVHRRQPSE